PGGGGLDGGEVVRPVARGAGRRIREQLERRVRRGAVVAPEQRRGKVAVVVGPDELRGAEQDACLPARHGGGRDVEPAVEAGGRVTRGLDRVDLLEVPGCAL